MNTLTQYAVKFLTAQSLHLLILFALVLAATMAMRHKSAHLRYLLWLVIVAKCLVPPLHTISVAILPASTPTEVRVSSQAPALQTVTAIATDPQQTHVESYSPTPQPTELVLSHPAELAIPQAGPAPIATVEPTLWERVALVSFEKWIPVVWLSGIVLFCLVIAGKAIRFHLYLREHRTDLTQETHPAIFEFLSATLPDKKPLRLYQLSRPGQPFVWGLLRPAIYLPSNFAAVNDPHKQQSILMHEAGHILRLDPLVNFLQVVAQGLFWFHPLVWIANRMIRAEREKCCDEFAVATLKTAPRHYCTAIVEALMTAQPVRPAIPTLAVAGPVKNIEDRIKTLLTPGKIFRRRPTVRALIVITLLAAIIVPTTIALTHEVTPPDYSLSGSVVDTDGKPIAGAIVFDDGYGPEPYQKGITDAAGKFEYKSWNEEHNITAKADDYTPQTITFTTWPFDNSKQLNFKLQRATESHPAALPESVTEVMLLPEHLESQTVLSLKTGQFILTKQANEAKEPFLCYSFALSSGENFRKFTAANIPENRIGVNAGNLDTGGGGFGDEGRSLWAIQKMQELPDFRMNRNTWEASEDIWSTDGVFIHPPLDGNWPYIAAFKGDDGTYGIFEITKVEDRKIHIRFKTLTDKPLLQSETETKPQISISMRAISIPNDDSQLQSLFDTAGIHMPQFAMSVSQDGDSTGVSNKLTYGQSALLTAKDVEQMLKAVQSNPDSKLLIAPEPVVWSGEAATIQTSSAQTVPQGQKQFSLHITPSLMSEGILSEFEIISSDNIEIKDNQIEETTLLKSKVLIPQDKTLLILGPDFYQEFLDKQTSGTKPQRRLLILLKTREYDDTNPAPSSSPNIMSPSMGGMGGGGMGGGSVGSMANNMGGGMGGGGTGGGMGGGMGGMGGGGKSGVLSSKTSPFTATLPNGVTVELLGICEHPSQGQQWWRPDGQITQEIPYAKFGWNSSWTQTGREFAVRVMNAENCSVASKSDRYNDDQWVDQRSPLNAEGKPVANLKAFLGVFETDQYQGDVSFGVACGPWEKVEEWRQIDWTVEHADKISFTSRKSVIFTGPQEYMDGFIVSVTHTFEDKAARLILVDKKGQHHVQKHSREGEGQNLLKNSYYVQGIKRSDIDKFIFETRDYEWITFKNVALRPGVKTEVEVVAEKSEVKSQERDNRINPLAELSIPPDASPRVANALKTIADTMNAVEVTGRDRLERLAGLFDRINESCDDLQGKNGTEIPDVPEWGQLPSRLVDILKLLHKIEETAEGCRGLAMADQKELLEQHWQTLKGHYNTLCLFLYPKQQSAEGKILSSAPTTVITELRNPPFTAMLSNGVTVELVGVCEHLGDNTQWWAANGQLIAVPSFKANAKSEPMKAIPTQYTLLVRATGGSHNSLHMKIYEGFGFSTPFSDNGTALCMVKHPQSEQTFHQDAFVKGPVMVGVAQGDWIKARGGDQSDSFAIPNSFLIGAHDQIVIQPPQQDKPDPGVTVFWGSITSHDYELKLVCTLKDGTNRENMRAYYDSFDTIETGGIQNSAIKTVNFSFDLIPIDQITGYELYYRQYEYARFENVVFKPGVKTEVEITAESPTPYHNSADKAVTDMQQKILLERKALLHKNLQIAEQKYKSGLAGPIELLQAKIDLLRVESEMSETDQQRMAILNDIVTAYNEWEKRATLLFESGRITEEELNKIKLMRLDAENELIKERAL